MKQNLNSQYDHAKLAKAIRTYQNDEDAVFDGPEKTLYPPVQPVATAVHGPNAQQPPYLVTSPFAYQRELGEQVFISSGLY
jgi:hypothetical protein